LISLSCPSTLYQVLWPSILETDVSQALKEILSKSLSKSLKARTGSFDEMLLLLRSNEEKIVAEMTNEAGFSIDVSPGSGTFILNSMWLELPETGSSVPLSTPVAQRFLAGYS
jgi:hypothetical protein